MKKLILSVVVCVYNEAGNILPLIQRIDQALQQADYELIYVNDGSTDATLAELQSVTSTALRIVDLQKKYGQSLALAAGIEAALGHYLVTLDGDLQNDPVDILPLVSLAERGSYDFVAGIRANRRDHALRRKLPSPLAGRLISWAMAMRWVDYGCGLKVIRADLAGQLKLYGELHRLLPVLAHLEGARMAQLPVQHHPRQFGQSKYGLNRTWKVICDLLLLLFRKKYLQRPMHFFGGWGVLSLLIGLFFSVWWLGQQVFNPSVHAHTMLVVGIMLSVAGLQFIGMGLLVDLQMRTYYETQAKKPYIIRNTYVIEARATQSIGSSSRQSMNT